mgnify:CR=1 FL=1
MREKAEKPAKRKLTRNQRKQIEAVIRQAKGDGKNHTVQDSIPFQNMFPDGLCRLEGGTFSKTIAFEDVNYRLAGPEDQRSIFESLCDFYNGYDPTIGVQVTLDSRSGGSAADEMFGITRQGNDLDPIRDEAVDILRMQYKRGNNGYVKTKYVTLTIEAENLPAARARFARIETDTLNRLKVMGAAAHVLDGKERLELLYNILHPEGGQFAFEWDWLPASGLSVKDFISPSSFHFGETRTFRIAEYTQEEYDALLREFLAIEQVPARMEAGCRNEALLGELRPWLTEFGKLGTRGRKTLELIKTYEAGDDGAFWAAYVGNLMTEQERKDYEAHKSGTMKLQPFYENAMDDMSAGFFTRLTGDVPASYKGIGTFANVRTTLSKLMFDNDSTTFYTSGVAQKEGDWTGADLGRVRDVEEVRILQGRNSVDDVDYFDHAVVEYSEDGKTWTPLTGELEKQYVINWSGEPVRARYVRLKRLDSPRTNWASVRSFEVNPVRAERLGFEIEAEDAAQALYAFDRNPGTSFENRGVLKFGIPEGTKQYTLLLKLPAEGKVTVSQLAADGSEVTRTTADKPFVRMDVADQAVAIALEGPVEIFEILAR